MGSLLKAGCNLFSTTPTTTAYQQQQHIKNINNNNFIYWPDCLSSFRWRHHWRNFFFLFRIRVLIHWIVTKKLFDMFIMLVIVLRSQFQLHFTTSFYINESVTTNSSVRWFMLVFFATEMLSGNIFKGTNALNANPVAFEVILNYYVHSCYSNSLSVVKRRTDNELP